MQAAPADRAHVPAVKLVELVAGLEHALAQQLTLAVAKAVGVDAAGAGVDIAPRLLEARGRGGGEVVDRARRRQHRGADVAGVQRLAHVYDAQLRGDRDGPGDGASALSSVSRIKCTAPP